LLGCANLLTPIRRPEDLQDPDIVKACWMPKGMFYITPRGSPLCPRPASHLVFRQTGLSAFSAGFLKEFSALAPTPWKLPNPWIFCASLNIVFISGRWLMKVNQ